MTGWARSHRIPQLTVRVARHLPVLLLLGLAVHLVVPQLAKLEHTLALVRRMPIWALGLAVLAQVGSYAGSGYLLRAISGATGHRLSLGRSTAISIAAASVGLVAGGPVGYAAATYRWARGSQASTEGALLAGWLPSIFNNSLLALIAIAGLAHLLVVHELSTLQVVAFATILFLLAALVGGAVWGMGHRQQLTHFAIWANRRWTALRRRRADPDGATQGVDNLLNGWDLLRAGHWYRPVLGAVAYVACDLLTLYFLFVAAGHAVSPGVLLAGYGLPLLLGKLSFLPGGVGVVEGTMAVLYDGLGVPGPVTVVVIVAYRAISFWLPALLGFPLVPYLQHVTGGSPQQSNRPLAGMPARQRDYDEEEML